MIQQFAATRLRPAGGLLVIAGDLSLSAARYQVDQYLGAWHGTPPTAATDSPPATAGPTRIVLVNRPGSAQCNILVGNLALGPVDPLYYAATVGNRILGGGADSRLFAILREQKSFTYDAGSGLARRLGPGYFSASTEVRTAVTDSALTELLHQLRRMRSEAVADSELVAAKGYLVGSFPLSIETPQQIAGQVSSVKLLGLPDDYLRTYRERLSAVTPDDVLRAARRVIRPDSAVIVVVGDGAAVHHKLARVAPVRIVDTDGKPVKESDLAPKTTAIAFDPAQLVARRDSFAFLVQGNPMGYLTTGLTRSADSLVYVEETAIAGQRQRTVLHLDPTTLATRSVDQTGEGQGLDIHLVYQAGRVRGRAQVPNPRTGTTKATEVDTTVAPGTIDGNALQPLLSALPLADGASFNLSVFDASDNSARSLAVKVAAAADVTVPAGTFRAFRVQVSGGRLPLVCYVSRDAPRRLVKIEIVGQPVTIELVK
jgi:hypothetical protein